MRSKRYRPDLIAFLQEAKIVDRLGRALAGSAHPRCIYIVQIPSSHSAKKDHPVGVVFFGGDGGI